ncbi:putative ABC transport system permease protein [Streptoalloteichus tenebrarius]|uniref:ABC transport system permease protein n=1 Tax=Streptoalloteichus tenebrarius (strain ATCC 17920 / DSM 40477 / JCM 4838 / CBS 697.72 / NBRC 16177 / NCIMB 11028 / NRRL B-12390 / A12253. 1 / ISP 5477) TaxID=1933 RepID=A0ABT1HPB1_STRSD|nr:FtsX family ABC transporter permease [Streptoalloteichus tenebrarius]MCP2257315.1 putative ABC transport system permease protein [Streptoalloteichus tenebrarius]BFF04225.1 FtsX-like permease family protein [Streptoalloteichus tenebrarius]
MALLRTVLAEVRHRPARLLLTGLAVVVATVFAAGSLIFTSTLRVALTDGLTTVPAAAATVVSPPRNGPPDEYGVPAATADALTEVDGVAEVVPVRVGQVVVARPGHTAENGFWRLASDPFSGPLTSHRVTLGAAPQRSDQVAVTQEAAERVGLGVGDRVLLRPAEPRKGQPQPPPREFTVTGVVRAPFQQGADTVVATPDTARDLLGGGWTSVLVAARPGVDAGTVTAHVRGALDGSGTAESGPALRQAELKERVRDIDALFAALSVFAGLAMVAAALVVTSTFRIVVAQRRRATALLRCVGASRGQVVRSLLAEAALSGLVSGALGVGLAVLLGHGLLAVVRGRVDQPLPALQVSPVGMAVCVGIAVVVTMAAALAPAITGSRVPPVAALGAARISDANTGSTGPRWGLAGLLALASAAVAVLALNVLHGATLTLATVALSGLLAFAALLAAGPMVLSWLARALARPIRALGGVPGRVAVGNVTRAPRRTAATTAVLTLGVTLVSAVLVGISSLSANSEARVAGSLPAQLVVREAATGSDTGLPRDLGRTLADLPETGPVAEVSDTQAEVGPMRSAWVSGVDTARFPGLADGVVSEGSVRDMGPGRAGLFDGIAQRLGKHVGDQITVRREGREVTVTVAAIYRNASFLGLISLHPSDLARVAPGSPVRTVLVDPAPGTDLTALRRAVDTALAGNADVTVEVPGTGRAEWERTLRTLMLIALGLVGMTVLVAVVGVGVTLSLSVVERTQESGLLRALGLPRSGLRAVLAWEATVFGACAAALGLGFGVLFGVLGVRALREFELVSIPYLQLAVVAVGLVLLALVAAVVPAQRAAKASPLQALAVD